MTYRLGFMYRIIAANYAGAKEIIISGAALLHSPTWMQMLADVLGQPLIVSEEAEATSRGAALVALEQLGAIGSWADLPVTLGRTIAPDVAAHATYQTAMERQQHLYRCARSTAKSEGIVRSVSPFTHNRMRSFR